MRTSRVLFLIELWLLVFLAGGVLPCWGADFEAVTKPSSDIELSFVRGGRVAQVLVKEGDVIKAGQLLASQDDKVEQIQLLQLKAKATNQTRIRAAEAQMLQKEEDLKKIEGARKKGAATDWEVEHARLDVRIARLSLQLARFEHEQDHDKYEQAKADVDRMHLVSPIDGRVEEVDIEPGESAQPMKATMRVVKTDPLWIDVIAPLDLARQLKNGQSAEVIFPGSEPQGLGERMKGRISFVSAVSRAASDTLRIRVEVPNPEGRPAGERVSVGLPGGDPSNQAKVSD
jgi:RND family efflux transporter MFP subunit